jgi:hypothetical protein
LSPNSHTRPNLLTLDMAPNSYSRGTNTMVHQVEKAEKRDRNSQGKGKLGKETGNESKEARRQSCRYRHRRREQSKATAIRYSALIPFSRRLEGWLRLSPTTIPISGALYRVMGCAQYEMESFIYLDQMVKNRKVPIERYLSGGPIPN